MTAPQFRYSVAEYGSFLAGVVAGRDGTHLFHLFVASEFQRQGLAMRLWYNARYYWLSPSLLWLVSHWLD